MTQFVLAEAAGMNYRHYQDIESGKGDPKVSTCGDIAAALDTPRCYLLRDQPGGKLGSLGIGCPYELLDVLPMGLVIANRDGLLLYTNQRANEIAKRARDKMEGAAHLWDFLSDKNLARRFHGFIRNLPKSLPEPLPYFATIDTPSCSPQSVKIYWKYLKNAEGVLIGFLLLISAHVF